jgi:peptide deformylase
MNRLLDVIQLGHPVLRQAAAPIERLDDPQLQQLIDQLLATMQARDGVGIAAPQVADSRRLLIVASRPNPRYPQAPTMAPVAMINPQIIATGNEQAGGWEGCLSVPGQRGWVLRYTTIEVAYQDRWGEPQRQILTDFVARIFQHEHDHLEGRVFLDRVERPEDVISEAAYQRRNASQARPN